MTSDAMNELLPRKAAGGGSHRGGSNSLSGIISTLVPIFIVAGIVLVLFLWLRRKHGKVYRPRSNDTILWQKNRRMPASKESFFSAVTDFKGLADSLVLERNCIDGYLFLRFFKILILISFIGCCITWPILFPVNATGGGGQSQLDILSFSNVQNPYRLYAHALVAWLYLGLITLVIAYERMTFIGLRQAYFLSPLRAERLTSRTILIMNVAKENQSMKALREQFGQSLRRIWMVTDCEDLEELVADRDTAETKLEAAEVKLLKSTEKRCAKSENQNNSRQHQSSGDNAERWIDDNDRPQHRLRPVFGRKVDTISWAQEEIQRLSGEISEEQKKHLSGKATVLPAAFIEFSSQASAQQAYQNIKRGSRSMKPCYIDVQPSEIIWPNLKPKYMVRKAKAALASAIVAVLILMWTPIVAFVGALTNINYLTREVPFLSFIDDIPPVILGTVTGLLPTLILTLCVILVPIICRLLSKKLAQDPTLSAVELRTQTWYFAFQVIQIFLVTTFSSGASAVAAQIVQQPSTALTLLAKNLPKASNFYMSYFILYGLAQAAFKLLSVIAALSYLLLGRFLDKTPRKMYNRWIGLAGIGWGSEYPKWTNLGVIAISYSCIAPLVLGFATIGFVLLYLAFRYDWLFVFGNKVDMKGEAYSRALQQLMTGVYLSCVCLIGLFAIRTGDSAAAIGPLVLMIVLLVVIAAFQILVDYALGPLEQALPLDMASDKYHAGNLEDATTEKVNSSNESAEKVDESRERTPSSHEKEQQAVGNKLTQRVRPYIDRKFFEPKSNINFELPEVEYEYETAFLNPAIVTKDPFVWLARDSCGVSRLLITDNQAAGIKSSDEHAWFQDGKLCWDTDKATTVDKMLEGEEVSENEREQEQEHTKHSRAE